MNMPTNTNETTDARSAGYQELTVSFLGSGSSGNSSVVQGTEGAVLLDCGFSAKETMRRIVASRIDPDQIRAIVVTHEHCDHSRGMRVLCKRLEIPAYATAGTLASCAKASLATDARVIKAGQPLEIAGMRITAFGTSHDAAEPVGYRFESECGAVLGIATDTGVFTPEIAEALDGCNIIGIECNHDEEMLRNGPYPWFLKQRIESARGHLSNAAAAKAVAEISTGNLSELIALHISETNNRSNLALEALAGVRGAKELRVRAIAHG